MEAGQEVSDGNRMEKKREKRRERNATDTTGFSTSQPPCARPDTLTGWTSMLGVQPGRNLRADTHVKVRRSSRLIENVRSSGSFQMSR